MADKTRCFAISTVVVTLLTTIVISYDNDPIPAGKARIGDWFKRNMADSSIRSLDPTLVEAEKSPKRIRVNPDGSGDFTTMATAISCIPAGNKQRIILLISGATYFEKLKITRDQPFVTFLGNAKNMPTLVFNDTAKGHGVIESASVFVEGDYFVASNIIFQNSAPKPSSTSKGEQAVAVTVFGDKAAFYNSKFLGYQDTLLDGRGKHYYDSCYIAGSVDFIWGSGKSLFMKTQLVLQPGRDINVITAQYREKSSEDTGFSFVHCSISGSDSATHNTLLGRVLEPFARVVYSYTKMSSIVKPEGWLGGRNFLTQNTTASNGVNDATFLFGEYNNTGPGAVRTPGSAGRQLSDAEAKPYLSFDFIHGSKWLRPPPSQ